MISARASAALVPYAYYFLSKVRNEVAFALPGTIDGFSCAAGDASATCSSNLSAQSCFRNFLGIFHKKEYNYRKVNGQKEGDGVDWMVRKRGWFS